MAHLYQLFVIINITIIIDLHKTEYFSEHKHIQSSYNDLTPPEFFVLTSLFHY